MTLIKDGNDASVFEQQADATLSQTNPVSGTKYTVLDTILNARILGIAVKCTWSGQPSPLEVHITIDGQAHTYTKTNPVTDTWYVPIHCFEYAEADQLMSAIVANFYGIGDAWFEGRSIKVEAEVTGGTVSNLSARVKHAQKVN